MMSLKRPFLGANWKMNEPPVGSCSSDSPFRNTDNVDVVVFPSFLNIRTTQVHGLVTGAQYGRAEDSGAFTGDISMKMLADQKVRYVLCGHSERRRNYGETDAMIALQVESALKHGIMPILCVGETSQEREYGETKNVLKQQLYLLSQKNCQLSIVNCQFVVAYEPVWAIGSGKTPMPAEAQEIHAFIRSLLPDPSIRILYGGSMNASNAKAFLNQPDIDGGLIGAASLRPEEFRKMVEIAGEVARGS